ncbi:MlaC/ttg2D family ABC transporter substrate-binding protein [Vogesella oryzae]|uniref:MlaC/ttg2D family ABC transporter substrate-binding protein n=1 Tax=Vogesella oryzae TaxID=1735285 RepID=UPI0015821156|nr:ABC transporter substrate-binding protein [Vogesella oryzae]
MKKLLTSLMLLLGLAAPALAADEPVSLVQDTSQKALDILKKENGKNTRQVREQVESMVIPLIDFTRMTALAVGKDWRAANPTQQEQLATQFKTLLVRTYSSTMVRFKTAQIDVKPTAQFNNSGREAVVKSEVTIPGSADKKNVSIDYTLYKGSQGWKIFNVSVEGASLVTVYRTQFGEEIRKNGIDGLIKQLKDKNEGVKPA